MPTKINCWRKKWLHDCFDTNFTLVMRVPPLDEKTNTILEGNMRYYLENSKKLMRSLMVVMTTKTRMKKKKVIGLKKTDFRNGA